MTMPDRLLVRTSLLESRGIEGLNDGFERGGLGRPLRAGAVSASPGARLVALPLVGVDLDTAFDALRRDAGDSGDVQFDVRYEAATVGDPTSRLVMVTDATFEPFGRKSGHAGVAWVEVGEDRMGPPPPWRAVRRRPVVALLDSGVHTHHWLPAPVDGQAFCVEADGWNPALDIQPLPDLGEQPDFGTHLGHGTFIAGLIRKTAPDAQVLSLRVMDNLGRVSEANVVAALAWLVNHVHLGGTVDVVLMAFGRPVEDGDDGSGPVAEVKKSIDALVHQGVKVVVSAGNTGNDSPIFPACYAKTAGPGMVSVGAGDSRESPAPFSSRGDWVTTWHPGTGVVSLMPLSTRPTPGGDGFAVWSGTSFAAPPVAAELAAAAVTTG